MRRHIESARRSNGGSHDVALETGGGSIKRSFSEGFRVFDLESWPRETSGAPLPDAESARTLLRRFAGDPDAMRALRAFLADVGTTHVSRLTDDAVVEYVAQAVGRGRFAIVERPTAPPPVVELEAQPEEEPESPAPEAPPTPEKTWIKFMVVDHATDQPISGVTLHIKLPSGETKEFTTTTAGLIYISNLDPGSCDVAAMIDAAAYEVVDVAVSDH
jgi:hypothetical protein